MIGIIKYYKTYLRYGLGYEGDAWFANNYLYAYKKNGFYIDIGCYHPLKFSQTHKLYKIGWRGINIDISKESIDLFKIFRPDDENINLGISNKNGFTNFYFQKKISTTNTLSKSFKDRVFKGKKINKQKIKIKKISDFFREKKIKEIDFLKIDCEGIDVDIIRDINFKKIKINFLSIEYTEYKSGDFINKKINNAKSIHSLFLKSEIYKSLKNNFSLIDHVGFAFFLANKKIY